MVNFIDCGMSEFHSRVKKKKLYCFGAGRMLESFAECVHFVMPHTIIDNYYIGISRVVRGNDIPVKRLDEMENVASGDSAILITSMACEEIIYQLDSFSAFNGMDCYIYLFLIEFTEHTVLPERALHHKETNVIPKKIHYCWFGGNDLSKEYKYNIESWRKYCPDYEIIRWDESNYDVGKNFFLKQAYKHKMWAFVSDYARVDIIYNEGGIYFDTDVEILKNFDLFLSWNMFCGFENEKHVNWGLGFGAKSKESVLRAVMGEYESSEVVKKNGEVKFVNCPVIQSRVMQRYGFVMNGNFQEREGVAIYPKEFFSPFGYIRGLGNLTEYSHSIHHNSASWQNKESEIKRKELEESVLRLKRRKNDGIIHMEALNKPRIADFI